MISSQPSGGDDPPRRSEGGSSRPRDGPARSHTLPYDRADKVERHDRPRPARRDSRAGPDVRERDWRRPSRPSNQFTPTSASLHASSRRDDRSARDRLLRERRRGERPRDRAERLERPERHERGDKLDRRSGWQHTSAPYIRETDPHEPNGHSHAGSARVHDDNESRSSKMGRPEPRFTRRPGNSFWDLMKGEPQRSEKLRSFSSKSEGNEESRSVEDRRVYEEKRLRHTERPKVENQHEREEVDRDHSQSVSPHSPYQLEVRKNRASSNNTPNSSTFHSGAEHESQADLRAGRLEHETKLEHATEVQGKASEENASINGAALAHLAQGQGLTSGSSPTVARRSPNQEQHSSGSKTEGIEKDGIASNGAEVKSISTGSLLIENVDAGSAKASELKPKVVNNSSATTDDFTSPEDALNKVGGQVASMTERDPIPENGEDVETQTVENGVNSRIGGALALHPDPMTMETPRGAEVVADGPADTPDADAVHAIVETVSADTEVHQDTGASNLDTTTGPLIATGLEAGATELDSASTRNPSAVSEQDVEMPDMVEAAEHGPTRKPHTEFFGNQVEYLLNYDGLPDALSEEPIVEHAPGRISERPGPAVVQTPQEIQLRQHLALQYNILKSEVPPCPPITKKWTLSAPDPRVSLAVMTQNAEIQDDIRARQSDFADRKSRWLVFCKQLDDEAALRPKSGIPETSSKESASTNHARRRSKDFEPEVHRRSRERSRAHGDVARSEAEFLEILANLEAETARDPLVRARQTSARIPAQRQGPVAFRFRSTDALVVDHSELTKRLKTDAVDDFTPEEHERFVEAYVKYPKEFGQIAEIVGRGFNECVMHYYRTKKFADYKHIMQKRRKSKRGRKPKKKEIDGELPTTPSLDGGSQFESPGTPKTPFTPSDSVAASASPVSSAPQEGTTVATSEVFVPDPMDHDPSQEIQPHVGQSTAVRASAKPTTAQTAQTTSSQQAFAQGTLDPRIPPPVFPLMEQAAVQINSTATGPASLETGWPPAAIAQLEYMFGLYGSRLDEIAQQMGVPSEVIRDFYERNHHKYLNIIQKTDSLIARSKSSGPNAGFFPPRNKSLPAKASRAKQGDVLPPVEPVQPIEAVQQRQQSQQQHYHCQPEPQRVVQENVDYGGLPPVVQPPNIQEGPQLSQRQFQPVSNGPTQISPQPPIQTEASRPENTSEARQQRNAELLRLSPQDLLMVKGLNLSSLPVRPCLPEPERLADAVEVDHDYPFQRLRESNERRSYAPA